MTPEEERELQKFREEQPARVEQARRIALNFGMAATAALVVCVYAFFEYTANEKQKMEHQLALKEMNNTLKAAEEMALRTEILAMNETVRARELEEECQQKKRKTK
ncbi:MAG TPA: hypothetical protein VG737_07405 [Cyclobacteriaceae bacterium]|nr:hypothetical protein [Cyclobacteriaceae bacterium]